jgi:hypothetical protein
LNDVVNDRINCIAANGNDQVIDLLAQLAVLFFTALLLLFTPPAFAQVPKLNVKALCNARAADIKILRSIPEQSIADCVREEEDNKQKLSTRWTSTSIPLRNLCESDARALGTTSYLDLFTCIEMAEDLKSYRKEMTQKVTRAERP